MVKKLSDLKSKDKGDFGLPKLSDLIDQSFEITSVRWGKADLGRYAIVSTPDGDYRTFSTILHQDLETIEQYIKFSKENVQVTLRAKGQYFIFE